MTVVFLTFQYMLGTDVNIGVVLCPVILQTESAAACHRVLGISLKITLYGISPLDS